MCLVHIFSQVSLTLVWVYGGVFEELGESWREENQYVVVEAEWYLFSPGEEYL